jgi:cupin fold WbuC family metalloprotein
MNVKTMSLEVYQAEGDVVWATKENVEFLKERAGESPRRRARMLAHPGPDDSIHEMLVVLARDNYIHPHIHPNKTESFHMIEGRMNVILFREDGEILEVVRMGDLASGRPCYYRQTKPIYHTIIPLTDFVAFTEVTPGPFDSGDTMLASWAPAEGPDGKLKAYIEELGERTDDGSNGL